METTTLSPGSPGETVPHTAPPAPAPLAPTGLGAEVRESLLLLTFAVAVTVGLTTAAQAALSLLS